jgi:drug/metabolite transporter (DMT)-like permease
VLASLNLSVGYLAVSLGYVLVIIVSNVRLEEPITLSWWVTVLMICTGVALVGFGSG